VDRHTLQRSFIDDKRPKLREGPGVECCALRPASLHPRANVRQLFQRNRPLRAFGLRNNPFGEAVVDVLGKAALLAGKVSQAPAAVFGAQALQLHPQPTMPVAHVLDGFAGVGFPIAIGSDVRDAQVNAQDAISITRLWRLNLRTPEGGGSQRAFFL
jgi:hypothetical protein